MRIFLSLFFIILPGILLAQDRRPSHCIALAQNTGGFEYLHLAAYHQPVAKDSVRITYVDHSTFLIQTEGGLNVATDFTGYLGNFNLVPDVVTMNHAHSSHWTAFPDPAIPHVLQGWGDGINPTDHHLDLDEMLVRNLPTDIRSRFGTGIELHGNSIFVFEVAGLCIGHLGHLHHEPDAAQYAALGRLDVVMAAVDGGMTLDIATMMRVLKRLKSSIVIPMHWFSTFTLDVFLRGMSDEFEVVRDRSSTLEVSLRTLPKKPTIMVLQQAFIQDFDD